MKTIHNPPIESTELVEQKAEMRNAGVCDDVMLNIHMERRAYDRVPSCMQARFLCGKKYYAGSITDVSEKGMFINTDIKLPKNSSLDIIMLIDNKVTTVPVTVRRTVESSFRSNNFSFSGMGVELIKSPAQYLSYVSSLKSAK